MVTQRKDYDFCFKHIEIFFVCVCKDFLVEMLNNKIAVQGQGLGGDINLCVQHI